MTCFPKERATAEISAAALVHNYRFLRQKSGGRPLYAVVKANAYGHGLPLVVKILYRNGCRFFACATAEEAVTVRLYAPRARVLILGYTSPSDAVTLAGLDLSQTVFCAEYARALDQALKDKNCVLKIHFKIDGGMTRLGFPMSGAADAIHAAASACPRLCPEGVYTHLPSVTEDEGGTGETVARFDSACRSLADRGLRLMRHAAASPALLARTDAMFDATRPGLALYGVSPVPGAGEGLCRVLRLTAPLVQIHTVAAGQTVGYGGDFIAGRDSLIGTVPIGYGDGIFRRLTGYRMLLCHGEETFSVPIAGRVCMDQTMFDLTDTPACVGDRILFYHDPADAAAYAGTLPYELFSALSARIGRVEEQRENTL